MPRVQHRTGVTTAYAGALVVMVGTQIAPSHSFSKCSGHVGSGARTGRQPFSAWRMAVKSATKASATSRIQFAATVVTTSKVPTPPAALPDDQVDDACWYLVGRLKPANSQAGLASYSSMNAAAIQALDEIANLTSAVQREFSGSIYKQGGAFKFTPAQMGGRDWSSSEIPVPRGAQWVATYHTHPDVNPNAGNFSPQDIIIGRGIKKGNVVLRPPLVSYLGTPKRQIKKLTPPELLEGLDAENFGPLGKPEVVR